MPPNSGILSAPSGANAPINFNAIKSVPGLPTNTPAPQPTQQGGQLDENSRAKLDGIVQQMQTNKEPDENIQAVVNDFKQKYSAPAIPTRPAPSAFQSPLQNFANGNAEDNVDMAKGALKGVATTLATAGAENAGPVGAQIMADAKAKGGGAAKFAQGIEDFNTNMKPTNLPQAVGMANEKIGEMILPVGGAASATSKAIDAAKLKAVNPDILTGTIAQGKLADVPAAKRALASVDTSKVKTYTDLTKAIDENVKTASAAQDAFLGKNKAAFTLDKLITTAKVGEQSVKHNFVQDAIAHLKELYAKTNDPVSAAKVTQLETQAKTAGLTPVEVNNLARTYGNEFGAKAFGKTGEPLTSVNAQALENTRSGLKATAAELSGDAKTFSTNDKIISDHIRTRQLVQNVAEKVNQLQQKVIQRGWGETIGRYAGKILDMASGHILKGAVESFIPRGQGFKVMNALDLEAKLSENLATLQKILSDPSITEAKASELLKAAQSSAQERIPGNSTKSSDAAR